MSRQSKKLYYELESLVNTVVVQCCVLSGPIPALTKSSERFSCLFSLHTWMQNFTTATGLGFISNFDYFWTEQDLFKRDGLHLNRMGTSRLINNLINFTAFSLKWHLAQLDPAQCPKLASHNLVPDKLVLDLSPRLTLSPTLNPLSALVQVLVVMVLSSHLFLLGFLLGSLKGSMHYQHPLKVHTETTSSQLKPLL